MIQMHLTEAGIAAIANPAELTFTRFAAGSGSSAEDTLSQVEQYFPIYRNQVFVAGQTYTLNDESVTVDYNAVEVTGRLDTSEADHEYDWTEMALLAQLSDGPEFCLAYGSVSANAFHIDPGEVVSYIVPFTIGFNAIDPSDVTVNVTSGGVPLSTFIEHASAQVTSGVHGLHISGNTMTVNGVATTLALQDDVDARTTNVIGIDMIVTALPADMMSNVGNVAYLTADQTVYKCVYTETIEVGAYVREVGDVWNQCQSTDDDALEVIADDETPASGEIIQSDAQAHFCAWQALRPLLDRTDDVEDALTRCLSYMDDAIEWNADWESQMTGDGTALSPYLVYTPYDLDAIRNNLSATYKVMNNIDMTDVTWTPIASFAGTFDGNGKTIKGIVVVSAEDTAGGLFSTCTGATIKDLTLRDSSVSANKCAGGIVGETSNNTVITDVVSYATVTANNGYAGGIVGHADGGTITRCANHGAITCNAGNGAGGIVGGGPIYSGQVTIVSSYNTGVCTTAGWAGASGICASKRSHISNCYNVGNMSSERNNDASLARDSWQNDGNNYSLDGCATSMQGTVLAASVWDDDATVALLNTGLVADAYAVVAGGYPALVSELTRDGSLPAGINLAVVDGTNNVVYPAPYAFSNLSQLVTKDKFTALKSEVATKSSVSKATVTLASADWSNSAQTLSVADVAASSALVLIPKSADVFTYGISITGQSAGAITFGCTSAPAVDIVVDVLAIN